MFSSRPAPRIRSALRLAALLVPPLLLASCDDPVGPVSDRFEVRVIAPGFAADLNDRGEATFTAWLPDGTRRAALWDGTDTILLPVSEPGANTSAVAINDRGDVLGYDPRPVVWRRDGEVVELQIDLVEPGDRIHLSDLNNAGVAVGSMGRFTSLPVRWSANGQATVMDAPVRRINAINDRGAMVGGNVYIAPDGTVIELEGVSVPPTALALNEDGIVAGHRSPASLEEDAILWDPPEVLTTVGPRLRRDQAVALNDRGEVVSWGQTVAAGSGTSRFSLDRPPYERPLVLDTLLATSGWTIAEVTAIDEETRIGVTVRGPDGDPFAAILVPGPELTHP